LDDTNVAKAVISSNIKQQKAGKKTPTSQAEVSKQKAAATEQAPKQKRTGGGFVLPPKPK
jgi:hypothetical protein